MKTNLEIAIECGAETLTRFSVAIDPIGVKVVEVLITPAQLDAFAGAIIAAHEAQRQAPVIVGRIYRGHKDEAYVEWVIPLNDIDGHELYARDAA